MLCILTNTLPKYNSKKYGQVLIKSENHLDKTKKAAYKAAFKTIAVAERAGFEPAVRLPVRQFSKLLLSATQAPLLFWDCKNTSRKPICKYNFTLSQYFC